MASSLSDQLTIKLRERIIKGILAPGTMVIEPALADEFQVSKTPVRESLRQLTSEGLLQILPKKGYRVLAISLEDIGEVLELRLLLEPHAAAALARTHTTEQLKNLRSHLAEQRRQATKDPIASMHAAQQFHTELAHGAQNSRVCAALHRCYAETARGHYVIPNMQPYMSQSDELDEHRQILEAITAKDPAAAHAAMAHHLKSIHRAMLGQPAPDGIWT